MSARNNNRIFGSRLWLVAAAAIALSGCAGTVSEGPAFSLRPETGYDGPASIAAAKLAIAEDDYAKAREILVLTVRADPSNVTATLMIAELYLRTGSPQRAVTLFDTLINDPALGPRAFQGKGIAMIRLGQNDKASANLEQAVAQDPTLWRAWNALGFYHDSQADWSRASESYHKALMLDEGAALVLNNMGYSLILQDKWEEAVNYLEKALTIDPELSSARLNLRIAHASSGKYIRALSGAAPKDMGKALNNVGYVAMLRGDIGSAEAFLHRAMEADPAFNRSASRNLDYLRDIKDIAKSEGTEAP